MKRIVRFDNFLIDRFFDPVSGVIFRLSRGNIGTFHIARRLCLFGGVAAIEPVISYRQYSTSVLLWIVCLTVGIYTYWVEHDVYTQGNDAAYSHRHTFFQRSLRRFLLLLTLFAIGVTAADFALAKIEGFVHGERIDFSLRETLSALCLLSLTCGCYFVACAPRPRKIEPLPLKEAA